MKPRALSPLVAKIDARDLLRFHEKWVAVDECLIWTANVNSQGYGLFWLKDRKVLAHRLAYEMATGPIPDGLTIDHLCRTTRCVCPSHLEAVTHRENVRRGTSPAAIAGQRASCARGHVYDDANTYITRRGGRDCRACHRERERRRRIRRRS